MSFHEPYASSACELMAELLEELVEQPDILHVEAEAMLSGIMLDTKDFTVRTGERTFEAAAFLRRAGADTSEVKKLLQTDMEHTVARYKILQTASIYRADIAIAAPTEPQERIVAAQAADELLNIAGVTASLVIYPMGNGDVFISARSIGECAACHGGARRRRQPLVGGRAAARCVGRAGGADGTRGDRR